MSTSKAKSSLPTMSTLEIDQHSLPVPEEMKTEHAIMFRAKEKEEDSRVTFRKNRRVNMILFVASIVGFFAILGAIVGVYTRPESHAKKISYQMRQGHNADVSEDVWVSVIQILQTYTPLLKLTTSGTPQNRAANWLAKETMTKGIDQIPSTTDHDVAFQFVERYALATFYYALGGDNWKQNLGFLSNTSVCEWNAQVYNVKPAAFVIVDFVGLPDSTTSGVECDDENKVIYLYIPDNNLSGELPPETGLLTAMKKFSVHRNSITGSLPYTLQNWTGVEEFIVERNQLVGSIPNWISMWTWVDTMSLSHNNFTGSLPPSSVFETLVKLAALALNHNQLTGSIDVFNSAKKLEILLLQNNDFQGALGNDTLRNAPLSMLDISNNGISGTLSAHFYSIKFLNVHNNNIAGTLPNVDDAHYKVQFLSAYGNDMTGSIPSNIGSLTSLTSLDLSSNALTGVIPESLNELENLQYLYLGNNKFNKQSFPYLADVQSLQELSLRSCNITDSIPTWIGNEALDIVLLDLLNNNISGTIPNSLTRAQSLRFLLLGSNSLSSPVPSGLWNLRDLNVLTLDHNANLTGSIGHVCDKDGPEQLNHVLADCSLSCSCCDKCCKAQDSSCGAEIASPNIDGGYQRVSFVFSDSLVYGATFGAPFDKNAGGGRKRRQ